jgi:CDP-diacylglycerol--serine O-phosphatidyltransferase
MRRKDRRFKRGAYLLPTLFTVGNLFCGFYSIVATLQSRFEVAALLILVAALLDGLDGRVARATGTSSEFGREFDSLSDAISFGVAPALMVQAWALEPFPRIGWLAAFLFLTCGVVRLARFNIQTGTADKRYFIGLPIPAPAFTLAACVMLLPAGLETRWMEFGMLGFFVALSLLMVSKLRFRAFKDFDIKGRLPSVVVVVVALAFVGVASHPPVVLLILGLAYVISGLLPRRLVQRWTEGRSGSQLRTAEVDHGETRR